MRQEIQRLLTLAREASQDEGDPTVEEYLNLRESLPPDIRQRFLEAVGGYNEEEQLDGLWSWYNIPCASQWMPETELLAQLEAV